MTPRWERCITGLTVPHKPHKTNCVFTKKHQFCFDSMGQSWKISPLDASPSLAKKMSEKWVDRDGPNRTGLVVFLLQKLAIIRIVYRLVVSKRYVFLGLGWSPVTILSFVDLKLAILRSSFVLKIKWFNVLPWFVCTVGFLILQDVTSVIPRNQALSGSCLTPMYLAPKQWLQVETSFPVDFQDFNGHATGT